MCRFRAVCTGAPVASARALGRWRCVCVEAALLPGMMACHGGCHPHEGGDPVSPEILQFTPAVMAVKAGRTVPGLAALRQTGMTAWRVMALTGTLYCIPGRQAAERKKETQVKPAAPENTLNLLPLKAFCRSRLCMAKKTAKAEIASCGGRNPCLCSAPLETTFDACRGEVPEWLNGTVSKTVVRATVPWVRIPPSPPFSLKKTFSRSGPGRIFPLFSRVMREGLLTGLRPEGRACVLSGPIFSGPHDCAILVNSLQPSNISRFFRRST